MVDYGEDERMQMEQRQMDEFYTQQQEAYYNDLMRQFTDAMDEIPF